jgi:hypothetical protein
MRPDPGSYGLTLTFLVARELRGGEEIPSHSIQLHHESEYYSVLNDLYGLIGYQVPIVEPPAPPPIQNVGPIGAPPYQEGTGGSGVGGEETPIYPEPPKQDPMPSYTCPVGYYLRTGSQYVGPGNPDGVMCVNLKNDEDQIMPTLGGGGVTLPNGNGNGKEENAPPDLIDPGPIDFAKNQWTGYLTKKDFGYEGNYIALGPTPPGLTSKISSVFLLIMLIKLSKTPEGLKVVQQLATKYLDNIGEIIKGIHFSSSSNVYTALINAYTAQPIYMRLGLMSPRDCTQNRAWIDHVMGEMLKAAYFKDSLSGLTTLVNSTSTGGGDGEKATGLGTLAKVLGA